MAKTKTKAFAPEKRRRALKLFMDRQGLNPFAWANKAGLSEGTIRNFLGGTSSSLSDRTYALLANAAETTVAELQGEQEQAAQSAMVAIRSYVGAGDEIISLSDDEEPIDWTPAPPGLEDAEATMVRGSSMVPLYHDGDLLFHRRHAIDPVLLRDEVVILQTRSRKRYVKRILPGTKKGHFHLVSFNSLFPTIEDQQLLWVAPILWVKKRQRI